MPSRPCLTCSEPTTNYCARCARTNADGSLLSARFYCDVECGRVDEGRHGEVHRKMDMDMEALHTAPSIPQPTIPQHSVPQGNIPHRAAHLTHALFLALRTHTWTYDMSSVRIARDQHGGLVGVEVTDGAGAKAGASGRTDCGSCAGGWLVRFPGERFAEGDEDAKGALLVWQGAVGGFVGMHGVVGGLFGDLVEDVQTDVSEVVHYLPATATRIVRAQGTFGFATRRTDLLYPDEDEHGATKGVYEIRLKCGSTIVLDLAGAQWALPHNHTPHTPVMHRAAYHARWVRAVKYRVPFRSHALKHAAKLSAYRVITAQTVVMETLLYFTIFLTSACKAELGFHPRELLEMDESRYTAAASAFLDTAALYLQKRARDLDAGSHRDVLDGFELRHPVLAARIDSSQPLARRNGSLPVDIGDMGDFDWKALSRLVREPASEVAFKEKKWARRLLGMRSVHKEVGTWQLVFLEETLPGAGVPGECVSENPGWRLG